MKLIEGVVEAISAKDLPEEDQWGNTHRISLKIGEDWVGLGSAKKPNVSIKEGQGWYEVKKGDQVAVVAQENGNFLNAKRGDVKLVKKGSGTQSQSGTSSRGSQSSSGKTSASTSVSAGVDWAAKDAGAAASASIDKALRYIALRSGDVKNDYASILSIARDFQSMVKTLAAEIQGKPAAEPEKEEAPAKLTNGLVKKPSKPKPVEPEEEFEDDELPF